MLRVFEWKYHTNDGVSFVSITASVVDNEDDELVDGITLPAKLYIIS